MERLGALPREELDTLDTLLIDYATTIRAAMRVGDFPNMWQRQLDADEIAAREAIMAYGTRLVAAVRAGEEDTARLDDIEWFGCMTGDCPHQTQAECDVAILGVVRSVIVERLAAREKLRESLAARSSTVPQPETPTDAG
jgi:hypothetical protein